MELNSTTKIHGNSGLVNTTNTCYLNSAIQMCSHTYSIAKYLLENIDEIKSILQKNAKQIVKNQLSFINNVHKKLCEKINNNEWSVLTLDEQNMFYNTTMSFQLYKLIKLMWTDNCRITPVSFKTIFSLARDRYFNNDEQQDAEEAYTCIMQKIQEELYQDKTIKFLTNNEKIIIFLQLKKKYDTEISKSQSVEEIENIKNNFKKIELDYKNELLIIQSYNEIKKFYKKSYSKISHMITGFQCSSINCPNEICNFKSCTFEPFQHLSISIPKRPLCIAKATKINTLEDCLNDYFKNEQLDFANAWKCANCQNKVLAVKRFAISALPQNLVIQLKRFDCQTSFKDRTNVLYPLNNLDMSPYVDPIFRSEQKFFNYMLVNVIVHIGNVNAGHYITYSKNTDINKWFMYNDDNVALIDESQVVCRDAYLLSYMLTS